MAGGRAGGARGWGVRGERRTGLQGCAGPWLEGGVGARGLGVAWSWGSAGLCRCKSRGFRGRRRGPRRISQKCALLDTLGISR